MIVLNNRLKYSPYSHSTQILDHSAIRHLFYHFNTRLVQYYDPHCIVITSEKLSNFISFCSGVEMGYENRDCNGEFQTGFMIPQGTIRRGSRCSTSKAFLRPVRNRKNLHVAMHAHVTKVLRSALRLIVGCQGVVQLGV